MSLLSFDHKALVATLSPFVQPRGDDDKYYLFIKGQQPFEIRKGLEVSDVIITNKPRLSLPLEGNGGNYCVEQ